MRWWKNRLTVAASAAVLIGSVVIPEPANAATGTEWKTASYYANGLVLHMATHPEIAGGLYVDTTVVKSDSSPSCLRARVRLQFSDGSWRAFTSRGSACKAGHSALVQVGGAMLPKLNVIQARGQVCIVAAGVMRCEASVLLEGRAGATFPIGEITASDLRSRSPISPGSYWYNSAGRMGCTVAARVRTSKGAAAFLTAGHCAGVGNVGDVAQSLDKRTTVGRVTTNLFTTSSTSRDVALVALNPGVAGPGFLRIDGAGTTRRVVGQLSTAAQRKTVMVCHIGLGSELHGRSESCGPIVSIADTIRAKGGVAGGLVCFAASSWEGDSGGPVYQVDAAGNARIAGVVFGTASSLIKTSTCYTPIEDALRLTGSTLVVS